MQSDFSALLGILCCPDDGQLLSCGGRHIKCSACGRAFPVFETGVAELLPRKPVEGGPKQNSTYWRGYRHAFRQSCDAGENATAWGAVEKNPSSWVRKRLRQIRAVEPLLGDDQATKDQILCDIAAGAGYYTLAYSPRFRIVLHCDLSPVNLIYAARKAETLGLKNVFFLRTDYFAMPFRNSVDRVLCLDTLVRGDDHEVAVLKSICAALATNGSAIVDLHNWWHNPVRRLGLLPENFHHNRSYRPKETKRLMCEAGITRFDSFPFHQEFEPDNRYRGLLSRMVPATRLLIRFKGGQACEC